MSYKWLISVIRGGEVLPIRDITASLRLGRQPTAKP